MTAIEHQFVDYIPADLEQGVLYGEVLPMQGLTPYLQWRIWPLAILCALLLGWALLASRMAKTV